MSAQRFFVSTGWYILTFVVAFMCTGDYVEYVYNLNVTAGGDPTFTGFGFEWLIMCAAISLLVLVVGLFGKLPFTR